jgi:hypothetical protein
MSESAMRSRVVKGLRALDAVAVENPARPGTPDVNYIEGWIELKQLPRWPAKRDTVVKCSHFRTGQRIWIKRRARAGGQVHVLLQVGSDWLLLPGAWAAQNLGRVSLVELIENAERVWHGRLNTKELRQCLAR